jgi:membrane complex biogenesis BtpA family protein
MGVLKDVLGHDKSLIGVVHLEPLPGSYGWKGHMPSVVGRALADASALEAAGLDAIILENFGDAPFSRGFAGRGAVAAMSAIGAVVAENTSVPLGINVLRSDALSAVAVAAAVGARFIRVNVHVGAAATDQGIIQGSARETLEAIRRQAPGLMVFADVFVKHARPLGANSIEQSAVELVERGRAAALIVTGDMTGSPCSPKELGRVRAAVPGTPVLVGSGVTAETVAETLSHSDGIIVGSSIMEGGVAARPIDPEAAAAFVRAAGPRDPRA